MYIMADQWGIDALKDLAYNKFEFDLAAWDLDFVKSEYKLVAETVEAAYDAGEATNKICKTLADKLVELGVFASEGCARSALINVNADYDDFGKDVIIAFGKRQGKNKSEGEKRFSCPECYATFQTAMPSSTRMYSCFCCGMEYSGTRWLQFEVKT